MRDLSLKVTDLERDKNLTLFQCSFTFSYTPKELKELLREGYKKNVKEDVELSKEWDVCINDGWK